MRSTSCLSVTLLLSVAVAAPVAAHAQEGWVSVSNFPEVQNVTGEIEVAAPIPSNEMVRFSDIGVTTVQRHQTMRLISGGVLETGPFTSVSLGFAGFVEGTPDESATIGMVLVPDEDFVLDALKEGVYLFPIEITLAIPKDSLPYVGARPETHQLSFPRYRVYLYNSGQRTVKVQLYANLMN